MPNLIFYFNQTIIVVLYGYLNIKENHKKVNINHTKGYYLVTVGGHLIEHLVRHFYHFDGLFK